VPVEQRSGAGRDSPSGRRRSLLSSLEPVRIAFRRGPFKAAEADLASLTARRDGVLRRLPDAVTKADTAAAEQRRLLIETDGADPVAMKKAGDACRKTADDQAALEDAARVLAEMVAEAQARVTVEQTGSSANASPSNAWPMPITLRLPSPRWMLPRVFSLRLTARWRPLSRRVSTPIPSADRAPSLGRSQLW
jgi:hypothetical protein